MRNPTCSWMQGASLIALAAIGAISGGCDNMQRQRGARGVRDGSDSPLVWTAPAHTVARGTRAPADPILTGFDAGQPLVRNPLPLTRELLTRGRERFDIYCAVCHGRDGYGRGIVVRRGFPSPPSYHDERLRKAPDGHFFDVITRGYGAMLSFADRLTPEDRWAVVAYIRALERSQRVALRDLSSDDRAHFSKP